MQLTSAIEFGLKVMRFETCVNSELKKSSYYNNKMPYPLFLHKTKQSELLGSCVETIERRIAPILVEVRLKHLVQVQSILALVTLVRRLDG